MCCTMPEWAIMPHGALATGLMVELQPDQGDVPVFGIKGSAACSTRIAPQKLVSNDNIICLKSEL